MIPCIRLVFVALVFCIQNAEGFALTSRLPIDLIILNIYSDGSKSTTSSFDMGETLMRTQGSGQLIVLTVFLVSQISDVAVAAEGIHAIIVADTAAQDISNDMAQNAWLVEGGLTQLIPAAQLTVEVLPRIEITRNGIQQSIAKIPKHTRCIFFYYSGHGFYNNVNGSSFYLTNDRARLSFSLVKSWLEKRSPKLLITIIDSCSVRPPGLGITSAPAWPSPDRVPPLGKSLFFTDQGWFHINSSSAGEYALAREGDIVGSPFTHSLLDLLSDAEQAMSWESLTRELKGDVQAKFKKLHPDGVLTLGNGKRVQQLTQSVWGKRNNQIVIR